MRPRPVVVAHALPRTRRAPWPRAAAFTLGCHLAVVAVNCLADGVVDTALGGGLTVGALLLGADAAVLLAVLYRSGRRASRLEAMER